MELAEAERIIKNVARGFPNLLSFEDLVQEGFLVFLSRPQADPPLFSKMVRNKYIDLWRSRKRRPLRFIGEGLESCEDNKEGQSENAGKRLDCSRLVDKAGLDTNERDCLYRRYWRSQSLRDIATERKVSLNSVFKTLQRAEEKIRLCKETKDE